MTKDECISKLATEVFDLRERLYNIQKSSERIHGLIYQIGGPLNDNVLKYTNDQLKPFSLIANQNRLIANESEIRHFKNLDD